MTAKKSGLEKYQTKFKQADDTRTSRITAIRRAILTDPELTDIERLVFGMTGSIEEVQRAEELGSKIIQAKYDPLLTIESSEETWLGDKHLIGQVVGRMAAQGTFDAPGNELLQGSLVVPLRHVLITRDGTIRRPQNSAETRNVTLAQYALNQNLELTVKRPHTVVAGLRNILTAEQFNPIVGSLVAAEITTLLNADQPSL